MVAYFSPDTFLISISGWRAPRLAQTSSVDRKANSSSPPSISRWMPAPESFVESPSATRAWNSAVSTGTARLLMLTTTFCLLWHTILGSAHWSVQFSGTTSCGQSVLAAQAPRSSDASETRAMLADLESRPLLARLTAEPGGAARGLQGAYGVSRGAAASAAFLARRCSLEAAGPSSRLGPRAQHNIACASASTSTSAAAPASSSPSGMWRRRLRAPSSRSASLARGCCLP
mmetsp:Transcript_45639/g.123057  ORF Transcript_45639/g.123057 Transcript_45639/m.123057 type:complete len:231 (+) Transcript_45639:564-1256(+)